MPRRSERTIYTVPGYYRCKCMGLGCRQCASQFAERAAEQSTAERSVGVPLAGRGFWGCQFCFGAGCLACAAEANRAYNRAYPTGPRPIFTLAADYCPQLAAMQDDGCPNVDLPLYFDLGKVDTGDRTLNELTAAVLRSIPQEARNA